MRPDDEKPQQAGGPARDFKKGIDTRHSTASEFREADAPGRLVPPDAIEADGLLHRFHVDGDRSGTRNGWYCLHTRWPGRWHLRQLENRIPFDLGGGRQAPERCRTRSLRRTDTGGADQGASRTAGRTRGAGNRGAGEWERRHHLPTRCTRT
jgi:hypothetical protein